MVGPLTTDQFWMIVGIQLFGVLSAIVARFCEGSRAQPIAQRMFIAFLVLVGVVTISTLRREPGQWIAAGTTLAIMLLLATCDFRRDRTSVPDVGF